MDMTPPTTEAHLLPLQPSPQQPDIHQPHTHALHHLTTSAAAYMATKAPTLSLLPSSIFCLSDPNLLSPLSSADSGASSTMDEEEDPSRCLPPHTEVDADDVDGDESGDHSYRADTHDFSTTVARCGSPSAGVDSACSSPSSGYHGDTSSASHVFDLMDLPELTPALHDTPPALDSSLHLPAVVEDETDQWARCDAQQVQLEGAFKAAMIAFHAAQSAARRSRLVRSAPSTAEPTSRTDHRPASGAASRKRSMYADPDATDDSDEDSPPIAVTRPAPPKSGAPSEGGPAAQAPIDGLLLASYALPDDRREAFLRCVPPCKLSMHHVYRYTFIARP